VGKTFVNNPDKDIVRTHWDTPLLRHLHQKFGIRYRYCGLPGVDLIDVRLWKDMIEEVVAFEPPDDSPDRRTAITTLRRNMAALGVTGRAYFGSFEEVVVLRKDFEGTNYVQDRVVTLYNLDFCNEIGSKIETSTRGKKCWRFHAIRQILHDQQDCFSREEAPSWFILMITVRNQIEAAKIREFLKPKGLNGLARDHQDRCAALNPIPQSGYVLGTHTWAIKTFLFNLLRDNLQNPHIHALFFPFACYNGTPVRVSGNKILQSPMLHALLLCRFGNPEVQAAEHWPHDFLTTPSVGIVRQAIAWDPQTGETAGVGDPSTVGWLQTHGIDLLNGL
jgi:hypothetical protein